MKNETLAAELYRRFDTPIRDPLWNHIYLDEAFTAITRTEPFDSASLDLHFAFIRERFTQGLPTVWEFLKSASGF